MKAVPDTTDARPLSLRTVPLDGPVDLLREFSGPGAYLWLREGEGLVARGIAARIEVPAGAGRFEVAARALAERFARFDVDDQLVVPGTGPVAFGSFSFDEDSVDSALVIPEVVIGMRAGRAWMTTVGPAPRLASSLDPPPSGSDRVRYAGSSVSELAWLDAVSRALDEIHAGRLDKVVLARDVRVWSKVPLDIRLVAARLAARFPSCFTFSVEGLVGATPELLARRTTDAVESLVLAGSARRGTTPQEDAEVGANLVASQKDRHEHELAVRSVRAGLAPLCSGLQTDPEPHLLRLANVQHLATRVEGKLVESPSALEIAGALHPTAAVCGVPTRGALEAIRAFEDFDRGRYAGPVGWVDARGDGEWAIALRCAEIDGDRARLFAGAGIVDGSLPEDELEETRLKLRAMQSALDPTGLP